jgi:transcriptional regulator with XRE-family HTH domain
MEERIYLKNFGCNLRKIRKSKNISQEELGFKSELHRTYIGMIERGEKNITLLNIYKLSNGLNVEVNLLFIK